MTVSEEERREKQQEFHRELMVLHNEFKELREKFDNLYGRFTKFWHASNNKLEPDKGADDGTQNDASNPTDH